MAKRKALENPAGKDSTDLGMSTQDPAFAILAPSAPEFAANAADSGMPQYGDEAASTLSVDKSPNLSLPGNGTLGSRGSFDTAASRRATVEKDSDTGRDPTSRIIQRLDLRRKPGDRHTSASGGGIASLIAASHTSMPVGPGTLPTPPTAEMPVATRPQIPLPLIRELPVISLAPNCLANPPAPTNLSTIAVIVNEERGRSIGIGRTITSEGIPSGMMANTWGSSNWGSLNNLAREDVGSSPDSLRKSSSPFSPLVGPSVFSPSLKSVTDLSGNDRDTTFDGAEKIPNKAPSPSPYQKTTSHDAVDNRYHPASQFEYPDYYPLQLKTQDAQFQLLFPNVQRDEKVVLVFKATWNPNDVQEFPGRIYVTAKQMYFYSNHGGMTLITNIGLNSISEITAANGKDCDFIFCHLKKSAATSGSARMTIKTFLVPLSLLQRRLNYLVRNSIFETFSLEDVMRTLIGMEQEDSDSNSDGWEHVSANTPTDSSSAPARNMTPKKDHDLRANVFVDRGLYGERIHMLDGAADSKKEFKLPKSAVIYEPPGMDKLAAEKEFNVSPKALFHVMFGDKSAVWQLLYHERQAQHIRQGPWLQPEQGHFRGNFVYDIEYLDWIRRVRQIRIEDQQMIDVENEHLLYVVSDRKMPWHLPYARNFSLLTKIVITHVAKSRCKLAVYIKVDWTGSIPLTHSIISSAARKELQLDALDLADVIGDQVRSFATAHARTKKAIQIFGRVGAQTQATEFAGSSATLKAGVRRSLKPRTLMTRATSWGRAQGPGDGGVGPRGSSASQPAGYEEANLLVW